MLPNSLYTLLGTSYPLHECKLHIRYLKTINMLVICKPFLDSINQIFNQINREPTGIVLLQVKI